MWSDLKGLRNVGIVHPLFGAVIAWVIAFSLTEFFALLAETVITGSSQAQSKTPKKKLVNASTVAAGLLIFNAVNLVHPYPYLTLDLSQLFSLPFIQPFLDTITLQDIGVTIGFVLLFHAMGVKRGDFGAVTRVFKLIPGSFGDLRKKTPSGLKEKYSLLRFSAILPAILQIHVLVADPNSILSSPGGIVVVGSFVLTGVMTFTLCAELIEDHNGLAQKSQIKPNEATAMGLITRALILSLIATLLFALLGTALRSLPSIIDLAPLTFAAAYSLLIIPYMYFYDFRGWEDRKIQSALGAIILLALSSSIRAQAYTYPEVELVSYAFLWYVLLRFPKWTTIHRRKWRDLFKTIRDLL